MIPEMMKNACWLVIGISSVSSTTGPIHCELLVNVHGPPGKATPIAVSVGPAETHQSSSSRRRCPNTAPNLSRILGLNDLSSASASNPDRTKSGGMSDKTSITAPR
jgi:hypothetical protein